MIIYMHEESAYRHWVSHHRDGFVLAGRHKPTWRQLVLHRATCPLVKQAASKRTHWTTGPHFKACSLNRTDLQTWVDQELQKPVCQCDSCRPAAEEKPAPPAPKPLGKTASHVLDYVLEVAAIRLDGRGLPYQLTLGAIAEYLQKTPRQITPVVCRLIEERYLDAERGARRLSNLLPRRVIYPALRAMRLLPYYHGASDQTIQADLKRLRRK